MTTPGSTNCLTTEIMADDGTRVRISCRDCSFEKVIGPDDDVKPADVLIEHGQRTDHRLAVSRIEE